MRGNTPKYILTKFWDAKIDIFDIIENNVILCVFEMSALGTTLMTVSIYILLQNNHLGNIFPEAITIKTLLALAKPSAIADCQGEFRGLYPMVLAKYF